MVVLIVKVEPIAGDVVLGVAVIKIAGVGSPRMILAAIATGKPNEGALQLIALSRRTPGGGLSMIRYSMLSMLDCEAPDDQVRLSNLGTLGDGGRGHSGRRLPHPGAACCTSCSNGWIARRHARTQNLSSARDVCTTGGSEDV
jgi:hypothetical protein